jgi:hypothetical protein
LELFANVLRSGANRPQYPVVADRMQGYLRRMSDLEPSICKGAWSNGQPRPDGHRDIPRYKDRIRVLVTMAKFAGFDLVGPGEELHIEGRLAESKDDIRTAFRKYSEGIEYLMAYRTLCKELNKPFEDAVKDSVIKMMGKAEPLKDRIEK